jgi:hypothetical protein
MWALWLAFAVTGIWIDRFLPIGFAVDGAA